MRTLRKTLMRAVAGRVTLAATRAAGSERGGDQPGDA